MSTVLKITSLLGAFEFYTLTTTDSEEKQRETILANSPFPAECVSNFQFDSLNGGYVFELKLGSCNMQSTMVEISNSK